MRSPTKSLIVRYLAEHGPMRSDELADEVGVTRRSVNVALASMIAQPPAERPVRILRWDRVERGLYGAVPVPVYAAGPGPNRTKPKPKTAAEKAREYRARVASPASITAAMVRACSSPMTNSSS
jgi:hypothetical protein